MSIFSRLNLIKSAGLCLVLITAWFSIGYHHPDEHYQVLEFAKYKMGELEAGKLPWEFHEQMRPGLQPFLAWCGIGLFGFLGIDDPFLIAFVLRALAGILAFLVCWRWTELLPKDLGADHKLLQGALAFFWMMPYLNVRFSSENMSAIAFLGGLLMIYPDSGKKTGRQLALAGFVLCLSFFFRYQIAFAAIGLGGWLLINRQLQWYQWGYLLLGALLAFFPGLAADYWLYGDWVAAPYNYFVQNIVEGKAADFGVSPWWSYFLDLPMTLLPPLSLLLFWFMGVGAWRARNHVFVWCLTSFILCHSLIGHKETRFMFPMIFPMFYLAAYGWHLFRVNHTPRKWLKGLVAFSLSVNFLILLPRCLYPANDTLTYLRFLRNYSIKHPGSTVFWARKDQPGKKTLIPFFYQKPWVNLVMTDSFPQLNEPGLYAVHPGDLLYFRTNHPDFDPQGFEITPVFRWFPDWLLKIEYNNWQERTRIWHIYQVK